MSAARTWYRDLFEECGEYAEEFCWGMTACFAVGPTLLILGILLMSDAIGNPPGQVAKTYNQQVGLWEKSGYAQFQAAWPINGFTVPVSSGGTDHEPVPLLAFDMEPQTSVVAPEDDNGETPYTEAQWFSGSVNLWAAGWPTTDQYYTLEIPGPAPSTTLEAYQCTNVAFSADGGACAAPQPGATHPPPAVAGRRMRAQRRRLHAAAAAATTAATLPAATTLPAAAATTLPIATAATATALPAATLPAATTAATDAGVAAASGLTLAQPLPAATVTPLPAVPASAFVGVYSQPLGAAMGGPPGGGAYKWPPGAGHPPGIQGGPPHYAGETGPKAPPAGGLGKLLPKLQPPPAPAVSNKPCTQFYRQVQFPAIVNLIATPPKVSLANPTGEGNWSVSMAPNGCGATFQNVRIPVTSAIYGEDIATMPWPGAPPAWCNVWGTLTTARPNGTSITLRSSEDPVAAGLVDTHCTYHFGLPPDEYRLYGLRILVLPGALMTTISVGMVMCMVARRRAAARAARGRAANAEAHEGTPLAAPGVFVPPAPQSAARVAGKPAAPGKAAAAPAAQRASYGTAAGKGFQRVSSAPRE